MLLPVAAAVPFTMISTMDNIKLFGWHMETAETYAFHFAFIKPNEFRSLFSSLCVRFLFCSTVLLLKYVPCLYERLCNHNKAKKKKTKTQTKNGMNQVGKRKDENAIKLHLLCSN